jgi:hypothetical protein
MKGLACGRLTKLQVAAARQSHRIACLFPMHTQVLVEGPATGDATFVIRWLLSALEADHSLQREQRFSTIRLNSGVSGLYKLSN